MEINDDLFLRTEGRRLAARTPDAIRREDVQVSIAGLRLLQLDNQIAIARHIGSVGIFPSHLTPLTRLEGAGALGIGALREERGVDILLTEREEGAAHAKRCLQLIAHRVAIGSGDVGGSLFQSTHKTVLQLHHLRSIRRVASLRSNVLGVSIAVGGIQGEIRRVAHHDFHLLACNGDAFSGEHILIEALEVLGIERSLVERVLGREPVEVGIARSAVGVITEQAEASAHEHGEVEAKRGLAAQLCISGVVERIVEARLARAVVNRCPQVDDAVDIGCNDLLAGLEAIANAQRVLSPHELPLTVLHPHANHGVGVLQDADASHVSFLQIRHIHANGAR